VIAPAEEAVTCWWDSPRPTRIFRGIAWAERVMAATRDRLDGAGIRWTELETLWDIDRRRTTARRSAGLWRRACRASGRRRARARRGGVLAGRPGDRRPSRSRARAPGPEGGACGRLPGGEAARFRAGAGGGRTVLRIAADAAAGSPRTHLAADAAAHPCSLALEGRARVGERTLGMKEGGRLRGARLRDVRHPADRADVLRRR
jgi:hypothetical protein